VWFLVNFNLSVDTFFICFLQDEPFTSNEPETIFNMAKFLLHHLMSDVPNGISKVYPLFTDFLSDLNVSVKTKCVIFLYLSRHLSS